ncbi:MAG: hypothetical protein AB203_02120 [Parcubacteria bacterium C7867-008]|nr:MAG: hypothetical protein AB203_02120 [Parcubacteria bacterium C7867-008]
MIRTRTPKGFTLLIAIILSTVVLSVGLSLLDVAYKQTILASTAKQSELAFYNADSALECALYYDQKFNAFDYDSPIGAGAITCSSTPVTNYTRDISDPTKHITIFALPCADGGSYATTTIYKYPGGATALYANGFNTCNAADPARIERGLKATYGDPAAAPGPGPGGSASYLIVGGGGGGGAGGGGGGGGGQVNTGSLALTGGTTYPIVVGTGGVTGVSGGPAANGTLSSAFSVTSLGGRGGSLVARDGGASGSGNAGGATGPIGSGAGGGGQASVGQDGPVMGGGNGGTGVNNALSGVSVGYAGGGGGGTGPSGGPAGSATHGAGAGGAAAVAGVSGTANTGGGGGGGGGSFGSGPGGTGADGVVIVSYPTGTIIGATGGSKTTSGGNTIHTFVTSGSLVIP